MTDISDSIVAKSDQLNAADLAAPIRVTVTAVSFSKGADQPLSLSLDGGFQPWKPCKGMRRLLVRAWGPDAARFRGRRLELFNDPAVTWAGKAIGGIRVAAMSDIDKPFIFMVPIARGKYTEYSIAVLPSSPVQGSESATPDDDRDALLADISRAKRAAVDAGATPDQLKNAAHEAGLVSAAKDASIEILERLLYYLRALAEPAP